MENGYVSDGIAGNLSWFHYLQEAISWLADRTVTGRFWHLR